MQQGFIAPDRDGGSQAESFPQDKDLSHFHTRVIYLNGCEVMALHK